MEAVAAQLRALPLGGEVTEDYVFDATGAGGFATGIRMSELFRGGDMLMMYHYMQLGGKTLVQFAHWTLRSSILIVRPRDASEFIDPGP